MSAVPGSRPADARPERAAHLEYLLRLADSALVHSQRLAEWCGHGPILEEDIALTNVALDYLGQARLLYQHAAGVEGAGRDEDALAYLRDDREFRNYTLLELPNGASAHDDYALTIARLFLHSALMRELWAALAGSADPQLAAIAARALKEARYHFDHARQWLVRFGDGTEVSQARAQAALERLWPYTHELFSDDPCEAAIAAAGIGPRNASLREAWLAAVDDALAEATLDRPADTPFVSTGKLGLHSEYLGFVLSEMQGLARAHPGARW